MSATVCETHGKKLRAEIIAKIFNEVLIIMQFLCLWTSQFCGVIGTPTKRQVSKRPVSKRLKRQVYKTSGLQNVRVTKCQVYKTSGLQNVRLQKNIHKYSVLVVGEKYAGYVADMFAGKVMAMFYFLF